MPDLLWTGPDDGPALVFAHGAGAAMDSRWMTDVAELLAARGVRCARFEFPYMAARRDGARRPPPRAETLTGHFRDVAERVVDAVGAPVAIGGKSLGGRVASLVADELRTDGLVRALVCLSYPFHPPAKPAQTRTAHLADLTTPTLICQGARDPFGTRDEVAEYVLSPAIDLHWLEDGDHDLRPRKAISGRSFRENLEEAANAVTERLLAG